MEGLLKYVPGIVSGILPSLNFTLWGRHCYDRHLVDEETGAQKG